MEQWQETLLQQLPEAARTVLNGMEQADRLTEIRFRADGPMQLVFEDTDRIVYASNARPMMSAKEVQRFAERLMGNAPYAWEEQNRNGFFNVAGGFRVGICGRAVGKHGEIERITAVTGISIRIVRERIDAAKPILPYLVEDGELLSTLLLSPPNCGKTTLLRDLIRIVSDGMYGVHPKKVGVADERFELSGDHNGLRAFSLGVRTDVLSGVGKACAIERILTTLSPEVLATDELTLQEDVRALIRAKGGGVEVLATAHGTTPDVLFRQERLKGLMEERIFDRIVRLEGRGRIRTVWSGEQTVLWEREDV